MQIKHTLIHKSCWEKRLFAGVSWEFFVYWLTATAALLPVCLKLFWIGILLIMILISIFYLARIGYEKDSKFITKWQKFNQYQGYYPAVSLFSGVHNDASPKSYYYDGRLIMKIFRKLITNRKKKNENILTGDYDNPYISGRREWLERYGDYISQNVLWRRLVIIALIIVAIMAIENTKLANSYKVEAQVFAQSPNGSLQPITPLDKDYALANPALISNSLQDYIIALRTVNPDVDLLSRYQNKLSAMTDNKLFNKTILPIMRNNFDASSNVRISVHISYIYPDGPYDKDKNEYKWVVVWDETAYGSNDTPQAVTYWMANLKLGFFTPKNLTTARLNPTSLLVEDIQIHSMVGNDQQSTTQKVQAVPLNIPQMQVYK